MIPLRMQNSSDRPGLHAPGTCCVMRCHVIRCDFNVHLSCFIRSQEQDSRLHKLKMATRTVASVGLALCQTSRLVLPAVNGRCSAAAAYHKIAFKSRHNANLSVSRSLCRAGRAAFATQVSWKRAAHATGSKDLLGFDSDTAPYCLCLCLQAQSGPVTKKVRSFCRHCLSCTQVFICSTKRCTLLSPRPPNARLDAGLL